ncbi:MAG TPA: response regulator, partial [Acidobacteriota bacterium]|nr:response regulator [Acidobacteriota bacterium]
MAEDTVTVLLVEDMPEYARLIQRMLEQPQTFRFNFLHAGRLSDGVQLLREREVDLILLDLTLPDSRGLKTLSIIMDYAPHRPVIVLTGIDDALSALKALRQGAQDYLV